MNELKNEVIIHTNKKIVKLVLDDFPDEIDVDEITSINYSNLYGEAITVSTLLNRVGLLKSEIENTVELSKLELDILEAEKTKKIRELAVKDDKKITEKFIENELKLDKEWQIKMKELISLKKDMKDIDSLFWAINSKDKKLSVMMKGVTPEELESEIVEGSINTVFIKKYTKKLSQ